MKKLTILILTSALLLAGCSFVCRNYTADRQAKMQTTLKMLQTGYGTMTTILQTSPDPRVYIAVALTDAALDMTGKILAQYCPNDKALALAEATARAAQEAKVKAGVQ